MVRVDTFGCWHWNVPSNVTSTWSQKIWKSHNLPSTNHTNATCVSTASLYWATLGIDFNIFFIHGLPQPYCSTQPSTKLHITTIQSEIFHLLSLSRIQSPSRYGMSVKTSTSDTFHDQDTVLARHKHWSLHYNTMTLCTCTPWRWSLSYQYTRVTTWWRPSWSLWSLLSIIFTDNTFSHGDLSNKLPSFRKTGNTLIQQDQHNRIHEIMQDLEIIIIIILIKVTWK